MKIYPLMLIAVMLVVAVQRHLPGVLYNNIGHLIWLRASKEKSITAEAALPYFERAIAANPSSSHARIGAAMVNIQLGNEEEAFAHLNAGGVNPSILVEYGNKEAARGDDNKALLLYKDSAILGSREGHILAGNICQHAFYQPQNLSEDKLDFCRAYFTDNENNLIVNANFESGDLIGWTQRYWSGFSGAYLVEQDADERTFTAVIDGEKESEVGSISQRITLPPGTMVRFSARVKAELQTGANIRLLHAVWTRPDGKPGGNQLVIIDDDMDWDYVERTLTIPEAQGRSFTFSPAILTGRGNVWIKDVRLEIVSES